MLQCYQALNEKLNWFHFDRFYPYPQQFCCSHYDMNPISIGFFSVVIWTLAFCRSFAVSKPKLFVCRLQFQNQSSPPPSSWNSKPLGEAKYATKRGGKSFIVFDFFLLGPYSNNTFFFREIIYDKPCPVAFWVLFWGDRTLSPAISKVESAWDVTQRSCAFAYFRQTLPHPRLTSLLAVGQFWSEIFSAIECTSLAIDGAGLGRFPV